MKTKAHDSPHKDNIGGTNFLISIYFQENHSWQGSIQWLDTGNTVHFRSELELMNLINEAVQSNQQDEQKSLRKWNIVNIKSGCQ